MHTSSWVLYRLSHFCTSRNTKRVTWRCIAHLYHLTASARDAHHRGMLHAGGSLYDRPSGYVRPAAGPDICQMGTELDLWVQDWASKGYLVCYCITAPCTAAELRRRPESSTGREPAGMALKYITAQSRSARAARECMYVLYMSITVQLIP